MHRRMKNYELREAQRTGIWLKWLKCKRFCRTQRMQRPASQRQVSASHLPLRALQGGPFSHSDINVNTTTIYHLRDFRFLFHFRNKQKIHVLKMKKDTNSASRKHYTPKADLFDKTIVRINLL